MCQHSSETQEVARPSWPRKRDDPGDSILFNVGAVIHDRYEVVRPVGRGGMGRVIEVRRLAEGEHLALKYCDGSALGRKRLVREARILGGMRHPHVVAVLDARLDHDPPYFVMPLAAATLDAELPGRSGDTVWAIGVFRQVCLGVQALHQAGVVHRDLKPANVLRLVDGRHVVADLGTAKREPRDSTVLTRTCAILGTLCYLAPEQLLPGGSRQADARTDVYQLGKMLYQMITGRSPAMLETATLRPALAHIILRATASRPVERYADVADLLAAIETFERLPPQDDAGHPGRAIDELLRRISTPRPARPYAEQHNDAMVDALSGLAALEADEVIDIFDRLPTGVLTALARDPRAGLLAPLLVYAKALERAAARRRFDYADRVAVRMEAVFQASGNPEIKARALQSLLVVAVVLNRYSAMAAFKRLLYSIRGADLALPVAEMLRDHRDDFQEIASDLHVKRLDPVLQAVIDDLSWIETVSF